MTLAEQYQPIADKAARRYGGRKDLYGAAYVGLMKAVTKIAASGHPNPEAYVYTVCKSHVIDFMQRDHLIRIPRAEFKRRMESEDAESYMMRVTGRATNPRAGGVPMHRVAHIENVPIMYSLDDDMEFDAEGGGVSIEIPVAPNTEPDTFDYYYERMHLDPLERSVLDMRLDGLTMQEIGRALGVTKQRISQILAGIQVQARTIGLQTSKVKISGVKTCTVCKREKSLSDFYRKGNSYHSSCKECMKKKREAK